MSYWSFEEKEIITVSLRIEKVLYGTTFLLLVQEVWIAKTVDSAMEDLKQDWMDFEIVEITMLIGTTIMLNRYCIALDIPTSQIHIDWLARQEWL